MQRSEPDASVEQQPEHSDIDLNSSRLPKYLPRFLRSSFVAGLIGSVLGSAAGLAEAPAQIRSSRERNNHRSRIDQKETLDPNQDLYLAVTHPGSGAEGGFISLLKDGHQPAWEITNQDLGEPGDIESMVIPGRLLQTIWSDLDGKALATSTFDGAPDRELLADYQGGILASRPEGVHPIALSGERISLAWTNTQGSKTVKWWSGNIEDPPPFFGQDDLVVAHQAGWGIFLTGDDEGHLFWPAQSAVEIRSVRLPGDVDGSYETLVDKATLESISGGYENALVGIAYHSKRDSLIFTEGSSGRVWVLPLSRSEDTMQPEAPWVAATIPGARGVAVCTERDLAIVTTIHGVSKFNLPTEQVEVDGGEITHYENPFASATWGVTVVPRGVVASEPSDGSWDVRGVHRKSDPEAKPEVVFRITGSGVSSDEFVVSSTGSFAPEVEAVHAEPSAESLYNTYRLQLSGPIPPGEWISIQHTPSGSGVRIGSLPGDVNRDRVVDQQDMLWLLDGLDGVIPITPEDCDIDRSGACGPEDVEALESTLRYTSGMELPEPPP